MVNGQSFLFYWLLAPNVTSFRRNRALRGRIAPYPGADGNSVAIFRARVASATEEVCACSATCLCSLRVSAVRLAVVASIFRRFECQDVENCGEAVTWTPRVEDAGKARLHSPSHFFVYAHGVGLPVYLQTTACNRCARLRREGDMSI